MSPRRAKTRGDASRPLLWSGPISGVFMSKELVISASSHERRVAILEEGQLVEIYIEREKEFALVGSIYKGKVTRVLPGMQSAFVDIGLDGDAFLYVSDVFENLEDYDHGHEQAPSAATAAPEGTPIEVLPGESLAHASGASRESFDGPARARLMRASLRPNPGTRIPLPPSPAAMPKKKFRTPTTSDSRNPMPPRRRILVPATTPRKSIPHARTAAASAATISGAAAGAAGDDAVDAVMAVARADPADAIFRHPSTLHRKATVISAAMKAAMKIADTKIAARIAAASTAMSGATAADTTNAATKIAVPRAPVRRALPPKRKFCCRVSRSRNIAAAQPLLPSRRPRKIFTMCSRPQRKKSPPGAAPSRQGPGVFRAGSRAGF